ncbi:DUF1992 domain-containing protein [Pseudooceanicola nitratireducens]|jgi:hypothetical protein|uniref:DnaJ homologue subfamily C member 28 conserved domain-containing protein n=1 Tax=Pseudooceanicola nitratireducens TaxID=517719 RepID=A0A1I1KK77_9RHOB|nr:DUF1992 domain-containing protein [Pseudooceanicola nitratireducens]MEC7298340.1 DUF1992 domain-containing protein [Pseudomonadota bacterium]MBY6165429.1 DUF1992 domain-containing protein [Pseudooceanicola nitratireducens]MEC7791905.1 DUF1992 domain-containing protein [Pseudomonadota bacterium]MEC9310371.1 DUF1992 domain-containing protein [Pseudomonadota bacterium]SEJ46420.1 protein of unknown function [Pseudooceanicola nitratireducens]|eukprot:g20277.t1
MDHPLIDLINAKIAEAEKDGAFDNLPGAGKPLPRLEDPENALLNRVIAENGAEPEFVTLSRQLRQLRAELAEESDRTRRREIMKDMSMMEARIDLARRAYSR